jgi:hypothetical protein
MPRFLVSVALFACGVGCMPATGSLGGHQNFHHGRGCR